MPLGQSPVPLGDSFSPPSPQISPSYYAGNANTPVSYGDVPISTSPTPVPLPVGANGETTVALDLVIPMSRTGLGLVPLKHSLKELGKLSIGDRRLYHDAIEWVERFSFAKSGGLPVVKVDPAGHAYAAGLRNCDVIVSVNTKDVRKKSADKIVGRIKKAPGASVNLTVIRCTNLSYDPATVSILANQNTKNNKQGSYSVSVQIERSADPDTSLEAAQESGSSASTGFGFTTLKYSFADKGHIPRAQNFLFKQMRQRCPFSAGVGGLPVQLVLADGPAARAGLEAWDLITHVNGMHIGHLKGVEVIKLVKDYAEPVLALTIQRGVEPVDLHRDEAPTSPLQRAISGLYRMNSKKGAQKDDRPSMYGQRADVGEDAVVIAAVGVESIGGNQQSGWLDQ